jgi:hypothetical protein
MINFLKKLFGTYKPPETDSQAPYKVEAPSPAPAPVVAQEVATVVPAAVVVEEAPKKAKKPAKPKAPKVAKEPKPKKPRAKKAKAAAAE